MLKTEEYMKSEKHFALVEEAIFVWKTPLELMNCLTSIWNEEMSLEKCNAKL